METDVQLRRWLIEALAAPGVAASPVAVARRVWIRHESELRGAGDLLYTWQLDLHRVASAMLTDGLLDADPSGDWVLPPGTVVPQQPRRSWTEDEIAVAVDGYLAMLRAEQNGPALRRADVVARIVAATHRTTEQVEALMSNISAVVHEHGLVPLASFRPRSNVPAGVRPVVAAALRD